MTIADDRHAEVHSQSQERSDSEVHPDSEASEGAAPQETSVAVYICTYQRNEPLRNLLDSLAKAAAFVQPAIEVGIVIVDDNSDQRARQVFEAFDGSGFLRGVHYRHSGKQNISEARNLGIEAASGLADWVAMVDDDEVVVEGWLAELFEVQRRLGSDAVTGPVPMRYPDDSPSWLRTEPFAEIIEAELRPDGSEVPVCSTGNSMIRTAWLNANPDIRFKSDLGTLGGEDMVFYVAAVSAGLKAHYALEAVAYGEEPADRSTFRAIMRRCYWMGNTEFVTNHRSDSASRRRLLLRAAKRLALALARPLSRVLAGRRPQLRFAAARVAQSVGIIVGVAGVTVEHE